MLAEYLNGYFANSTPDSYVLRVTIDDLQPPKHLQVNYNGCPAIVDLSNNSDAEDDDRDESSDDDDDDDDEIEIDNHLEFRICSTLKSLGKKTLNF